MNEEKLTNFPPDDLGNCIDFTRPFLSACHSADRPHRIATHQHPRAQILYPSNGVYRVSTDHGNWVVPPSQLIWIPPLVAHGVSTNCAITSRVFFFDETYAKGLPERCTVMSVSPLLKEMLYRITDCGNNYEIDLKKRRFFQTMLDELERMPPAAMDLPLATDKRARAVMMRLIENPASNFSLEKYSREVGASSRTLERLFLKESEMSFSEWRNTLRLQEAIEDLAQGLSVTEIAIDLGYSSTSAFIAMFKRKMGVSPGAYIASQTASAKI